MHQYNPQHFFTQVWIERQRFPHKVIYRRNCFHAGKAATATTKVSNDCRSIGSDSEFASSKRRRIWARSRIASGSAFIVNASSEKPGRLGMLVIDPRA